MANFYLRKVLVTVVPSSGTTKLLEDLRITFRCDKTLASEPNTLELEILNLSDKTRSLLETPKTRIFLDAGYEGTVETIFKGNITKVVHEKDGPDIISRIEVADGGNKFRNARIERGFPPGTKTRQVVDALIQSMDLPRGSITGIPDTQYANGVSLSGFAKDRLNEIAKKNGLEWSIQDEAIQIIPREETTQEQEILLSPDTGLIGSPGKTKEGVEFVSLMQPRLVPGRRVKLDSRFVKGTFKLTKVVHVGDNQRNEFVSECESKVKKKKGGGPSVATVNIT